jgi:hypothetical protein
MNEVEKAYYLNLSNSWQNSMGNFYPINVELLHENVIIKSKYKNLHEAYKNKWNKIYILNETLIIENDFNFPNRNQLKTIYEVCEKINASEIIFKSNDLGNFIIWEKIDYITESLKGTIEDYETRVEAGRRVENNIINELKKRGIRIDPPTNSEDVKDKIDGWWIGKNGKRYSVQIKFRETGNDILFEILKDIDRRIIGRDMGGTAVLYLVSNKFGFTRLYHTKVIKDKAEDILRTVIKDLEKNPTSTEWEGLNWQAKVQYDINTHRRKLVSYIDPRAFDVIADWKLDI